jgi:DNA-binding response OmpR family regulator
MLDMETERSYNEPGGAVKALQDDMARILIIGESESAMPGLVPSVAGLSHFTRAAWDLESLSDAVANGSPELVILDLRNGERALASAKDLVAQYDQVAEAPRIAVTESTDLAELQSKYLDDFILYPYEVSELAVRLGRLLTRSHKSQEGKIISFEGLEIDTDSFEVTVDSRQLTLTFKEFELLRFLAAHPGRVHTREALLNQVWGYEYFGGLRTVDVHVRRIRAKLGQRHENCIQTVHGVGYKFVTG